jgi:hypothetical protein
MLPSEAIAVLHADRREGLTEAAVAEDVARHAARAPGAGNGGALTLVACSAVISNCVFSDNYSEKYAGAAYLWNASALFSQCRFVGGYAGDNGGALFMDGNGVNRLLFTNCVFVGNQAGYAGVMRVAGSTTSGNRTNRAYLVNCTLAGNRATTDVGAIYSQRYYAQVALTNCISWGNSAVGTTAEIGNGTGSALTADYSDIAGGFAGSGNVSGDPLYAGGAGGTWLTVGAYNPATRVSVLTVNGAPGWATDELVNHTVNPDTTQYRQFVIKANSANSLTVWGDAAQVASAGETFQVNSYAVGSTNSPCFNAATATGAPAVDILGVARPLGGGYDMGAYELLPPPVFLGTLFRFQ